MQVMSRENKALVGAKIHHAFDRIPAVWPECRVIHMVRDPRDVARSIVQMRWEGNLWAAARWWREAEETWERLRAQLRPERFIEVTFCEIVSDPKKALDRICSFLGVAFSDEMLRYHERSTYEAPNPSMDQRWKSTFTRHEVALVESGVGELLESRGYERMPRTVLARESARRHRRQSPGKPRRIRPRICVSVSYAG